MRYAFIALVACAVPAAAQGTIGGQGFGYPTGQMSARAAGTGGALAPFDAMSPVNPASLSGWLAELREDRGQRSALFFHLEPEFRSTSTPGASASTRVSRYPLSGIATQIGSRLAAGLTISTYLDRTWETAASGVDTVGSEEVAVTTRFASNGAINDLRAAFAWSFSPAVQVGLGYHVYTGENRLGITWDFDNNESLGDVTQSSTLAYSGSAVSAGAEFRFGSRGAVTGYGRIGGAARMHIGDTLVARGDMPSHYGVAAHYDGLAGTVFAAGWERIEWTAMSGLGTTELAVRDGDRLSLGVQTRGPTVGGTPMFVRAGIARRTLPFDAAGGEVRETLISLGSGFRIPQQRGNIDITLQRALRSAGDARERAWLVSIGLAIYP
jgi:hypothetical protein